MVIYEVNLDVEPDLAESFVTWLRDHVSEMLEIEGFNAAEIYREESEQARPRVLTVRYCLDSREALEQYFKRHAERMRADGQARFGNRFSATRRILHPLI